MCRALEPALGKMVHREVIGSITDDAALDRILAEFDIDHVYHLAAYLSTRSEFTPVTAHQVNVEGTMNLLEFAQKQGESHGRPVVFLYPVVDRRLRPARSRNQGQGRQGARGGVQHADDDVRLQQAVLRTARALLRAPLQAAVGGAAGRQGRLPRRPLPGADLRRDGAVRRHLRLRAGDDSRRRQGRGVRLLRPARHAHPVHGDAGRRRGAAQAGVRAAGAAVEDRLQRRRLQSRRPRRSGRSSSRTSRAPTSRTRTT